MNIELVLGDITTAGTEIIVTAANERLAGGGGVDGAVHRAAGPELLDSLRDFGGCPTGDAVSTAAYGLEKGGTHYVVHAVGPVWRGGGHGEDELLASAYRQSIKRAVELFSVSVALPSISTGVYGFPIERAAPIAIEAVRDELRNDSGHLARVVFYLFDESTFRHFESALVG
ncbi:MAG: macro domain-containing protein [Myxococcota bacterium]